MRTSILICMTFLLASNTKKMVEVKGNSPGEMQKQFDKEGHRGCRGLMPENTIPAMIKAVDLGVTTLEMDAQITKDRQVLISHDPYFNHQITTKPDGKEMTAAEEKNYVIYRMDYLETQSFDVGLKPNPKFPDQQRMSVHKPLLSALIDSVENYCKREKKPLPFYNIETKCLPSTDNIYHPLPVEFVDLLMGVILAKNIQSRVIIQSFDPRTLVIVNQKYPGTRTALLIEGYDRRGLDQQINQLGFTPSIYSPEYTLVTDSLVMRCHERKMKIIPWTVNERKEIDRLVGEGVDGIITDYPNLF
ncbi:MAG: glycerophosphodiester phosphodiesterase family protein [Chitinophagales bacterium]